VVLDAVDALGAFGNFRAVATLFIKVVEMKRLRIILAVIATLLGIYGAPAQQRSVIAGLENNTEYLALIAEEGALVHRADSLSARIASLRGELRAEGSDRERLSAEIVTAEELSFEIRSSMARLASRINTIEQEWILASLTSPAETPTAPTDEAESEGDTTANLVYSPWFASRLAPEELSELHRAQQTEAELPLLVTQYREGHSQLAELAREYSLATLRKRADSLHAAFDSLSIVEDALAGQIGELWGGVFDSKSYLYSLVADKENREDMLSRFEQGMENVRQEQSRWGEEGVPTALLDYVLQKRMLTDYEIALAGDMANSAALDSLRGVAAALPGPASLTGLAPVELRERLFLDYSPVTVGGSPYNSANPIPEVVVWPKGVIWRVRVGNFASRQGVSVFRGAHPLGVQEGDDDRFRYFAGGFPTDSLAEVAVGQLREAGFRAPAVVVWMDGVMIDPAAAESDKIYRVDISGVEELSPPLREAIATAEVDIVRTEDAFILAPLDASQAVGVRSALEALRGSIPEMEAKLSKISE
jgi:hypothetical protein